MKSGPYFVDIIRTESSAHFSHHTYNQSGLYADQRGDLYAQLQNICTTPDLPPDGWVPRCRGSHQSASSEETPNRTRISMQRVKYTCDESL